MKPELARWPGSTFAAPERRRWAVVFVHGIYSSHETFNPFYERMSKDKRYINFEVFYYDYNYHDSLEANGQLFAEKLQSVFDPGDLVFIVAHSMGGLVARIAILSEQMLFIRCLFLLGTPNLGAIRIAQLSLLSQLLQKSVNAAFAVFPRKRGIVDLTRAGEILEALRDNAAYADHVDYVTIPGLFYHEAKSIWDFGRGLSTRIFSSLRFMLGFLETTFPLLAIKLSLPHDGVVERTSNNLIPAEAGRESEKKDSINFQVNTPVSYAHVEPDSCRGLNHVQLQADRDIFEAIAEIIFTPPTPVVPGSLDSRLQRWCAGLSGLSKRRITRVQTAP